MGPIASLAPGNTARHSPAKAGGRVLTIEKATAYKLRTVTREDEQSHRKAKAVRFVCFVSFGYYCAFKHHYSDIRTTLLLTVTLIFNSRFEKIIFQQSPHLCKKLFNELDHKTIHSTEKNFYSTVSFTLALIHRSSFSWSLQTAQAGRTLLQAQPPCSGEKPRCWVRLPNK